MFSKVVSAEKMVDKITNRVLVSYAVTDSYSVGPSWESGRGGSMHARGWVLFIFFKSTLLT